MVARRSGRGHEPADDRNTSYRSHSRSSRGNSRYGSSQHGLKVPRASRIDGRTRPATRRPYHDTFYEDLLTDGVFENPSDDYDYEDVALSYADYEAFDNDDYDDDEYEDEFEDEDDQLDRPIAQASAADYARSRYRSKNASRSSRQERASYRERNGRAKRAFSDDFDGRDETSAQRTRGDYNARGSHDARRGQGTSGARSEYASHGSHASRYSSLHAADRYRKPAKKRGIISRKRVIISVIALVIVLIGGGIFAYMNEISGNLQRGVDNDLRNSLVKTDMANEPFYMLLLGTDGSLEREAIGEFGDMYRSDSMMLVRIDPVEKKAALVSISRDIMVDLGEYGEQKLNAAYGLGGPALTVKAVSELTGVDISHYAQVDFDGFRELVDALGGVTVDVPVDIDDNDAGGRVSAGEQVLDGEKALILCRSRNTYNETAAQPDAMRAANQRLVMSAIAHKLLDADVATIANSVKSFSNFVTTDLSLSDIIGLAQALKGLDSSTDIYTAMAPTKSQYVKDVSIDYIDKQAWKKMIERIEQGLPPTEEAEIDEITGTIIAYVGSEIDLSSTTKYATVTVKNGTEREGLANQTRNVLLSYGFKNVIIGDVNQNYTYPHTLVIYDKENAAFGAQQIASIIEQGKVIHNDGQYLMPDTDYLIIIGEDWI